MRLNEANFFHSPLASFPPSFSQLRGGSRVLARPVSVSILNRPEARSEQVWFLMLNGAHVKRFKHV